MKNRSVNFEKSEKVNFNGFSFLEKREKKNTNVKQGKRKKGERKEITLEWGGDVDKNENPMRTRTAFLAYEGRN